eukprot:166387-Pyramimonas_sp.AAC.1
MELHCDRIRSLAARLSGKMLAPDGAPPEQAQHLQYPGAHLSADADIGHELCRTIAVAKRTFTMLRGAWSHYCLTWPQLLRTSYSKLWNTICTNEMGTERMGTIPNGGS